MILALNKKGGRNFSGRVTIRHQGGGVKRLYRIVDFGQEKIDMPGKIVAIEYDPNRTAYLALIEYKDGKKGYILAHQGSKVGDAIICSEKAEALLGNRLKLKYLPVGTQVFNIEIEPGRGGKMARGAGTTAKVLAQEGIFTHLEMPSGETRKIFGECFASVGQVSHAEKKFEKIGKAGIQRLKGWRPSVRGTAMNPCDHPHGHGGGRTSRGMKYPKTPWGKHASGVRTRRDRWTSKFILKRRK